MPAAIDHLDTYTISGTVDDIDDGALIDIFIQNHYPDPSGGPFPLKKTYIETVAVTNGVFIASNPFIFLGSGDYLVGALLVSNNGIADSESGIVNAP